MSAPPYMKLYVGDYLGDTHHLGALEHGAYLVLLMTMWRAGGSLPASDANLCRMARCTPEQWAEIRDVILPFFHRSRGKLTHKRLAEELAKYENTSGKRSEAGKRGAAKKASENNAPASAIASSFAEQLPTYPEPEPEPERYRCGGVGASDAVSPDDWPIGNLVEALVAATASPHLDHQKSPGLITTSGRIAAWKRDGASWVHDVLPVVAGLCAAHRGQVATWKFFDGAIARSIAENRRALEIPEAAARPQRSPSLVEQIGQERAEARRLAISRMEAANG